MASEQETLMDIYVRLEATHDALEVLGVQATSSVDDIRVAYRRLALLLHPDKAPHGKAEYHTELFRKIHGAYETLKGDYGASRHSETKPHDENAKYFEDLRKRNLDFREHLKEARSRALKYKQDRDILNQQPKLKWFNDTRAREADEAKEKYRQPASQLRHEDAAQVKARREELENGLFPEGRRPENEARYRYREDCRLHKHNAATKLHKRKELTKRQEAQAQYDWETLDYLESYWEAHASELEGKSDWQRKVYKKKREAELLELINRDIDQGRAMALERLQKDLAAENREAIMQRCESGLGAPDFDTTTYGETEATPRVFMDAVNAEERRDRQLLKGGRTKGEAYQSHSRQLYEQRTKTAQAKLLDAQIRCDNSKSIATNAWLECRRRGEKRTDDAVDRVFGHVVLAGLEHQLESVENALLERLSEDTRQYICDADAPVRTGMGSLTIRIKGQLCSSLDL